MKRTGLLFVAVLLAGAARVSADDLAGTYNYSKVVDRGRDRATLNYTLKLSDRGRAELTTEMIGYLDDSRDNRYDYGEILTDLDRNHRVTYTGSWRARGSQVIIDLDTPGAGASAGRYRMRIEGYQRGDQLSMDRLSGDAEEMYGSEPRFTFERKSGGSDQKMSTGAAIAAGVAVVALAALLGKKHDDRDRDDGFHDSYVNGSYQDSQRIDDGDRRGELRYRVRLKSNGDAELTTERQGDLQMSRANIEDYGRILEWLGYATSVVHSGNWKHDGDRITIYLDELEYGRDRDRFKVKLQGRLRGDTLEIDEFDRYGEEIYGTRTRFRFRKD